MSAEERALEVEVRVGAPLHVVFAYFTDPDKYRRWKGVRAELDPRPGGGFRVDMGPNGWVAGQYVEIDSPNRVVFTWGWKTTRRCLPDPLGSRSHSWWRVTPRWSASDTRASRPRQPEPSTSRDGAICFSAWPSREAGAIRGRTR